MTQAVTLQSGLLPRTPLGFPSPPLGESARWPRLIGSSALLAVRPGQLWFTVLPLSEHDPSPLVYRAVTTVNVIIYDRLLAPTVSRLLPLGGYAEPSAAGVFDHPPAERSLGFLRDGWSVARLVHPAQDWQSEIRRLSAAALSSKAPADLPVALFADRGGDVYENSASRLEDIDELIDGQPGESVSGLTFVFEAIAADATPRPAAASTNGLAG